MLESEQILSETFDFWSEATAWVERLANTSESLPQQVIMDIVR